MKNFFRKVPVDTFLKASSRLTRHLNVRDLVALGTGVIIRIGISILPGHETAQRAGPAVAVSFLLAAIVPGIVGMIYAESSFAMPVVGSAYSLGSVTYGEIVGWTIGWGLLPEYFLTVSAEATGLASHFNNDILAPIGIHLPKAPEAGSMEGGVINPPTVLIILIVAPILYQGADLSKRVENIAVIIKVAITTLFIAIRLSYIKAENHVPLYPKKFQTPPLGTGGISTTAATAFLVSIGFDALAADSVETKDPAKNVVKGIMGTVTIVVLLCVSFSSVLAGMVNYRQLNVDDPVVYVLEVVGLTVWNKSITVGALVGISTTVITMLLGGSRLLYALGRDGLLPDFMGSVYAKKMIPDHAVIVLTVVAVTFAGLVPLMELTFLINAGTLIAFVLVSFGIIPLRHRKNIANNGFKMSLYLVLPVIPRLLSVYFTWMLPKITKIMVGIWLIARIVVYTTHGVKYSKLQK